MDERRAALKYFLDHTLPDIESLAQFVYDDYREWRKEGWSSGDAYCAIVGWIGSELDKLGEIPNG